jgi:hypothetical protein
MERQVMEGLRLQEAPEGFDPLESQKALQKDIRVRMERIGAEVPVSDVPAKTLGQLTKLVMANGVALQQELAETLDWLPWKWWKNYDDTPERSVPEETAREIKFEIIDMLHFLINMAIAVGMDWDEMMDIFYTKQQENRARQARGY